MEEITTTIPTTPKRNSHSSSVHTLKQPPLHLSEFYSFVNTNNTNNNHHHHNNNNNNNNNNNTGTTTNNVFESPISATSEMTSIGRGGNPSFISTSSNLSNYANSELNDEDDTDSVIITLKDILKIIKKYEQVIIKAENYSKLLVILSKLSSEFGESIESLTKLKGCDEVGEDFYKTSGLQYVNSNYDLILSKMINKNFIEPLKVKLINFKNLQLKNDENFQKSLRQRLDMLQLKESELKKFNKIKRKNLNMNLNKYKFNLISITNELNSIDNFKKLNYQEILSNLQKFHQDVLQNLSMIIRLQLEINEIILKKSWSGGGLDELISKCPDPFNDIDDIDEDIEDLTLNDIIEEDDDERDQDQQRDQQQEQEQEQEQQEDGEEDESSLIRDASFSLPTI